MQQHQPMCRGTYHILALQQLLGEHRRQATEHVPAAVDDHRLRGQEGDTSVLGKNWQSSANRAFEPAGRRVHCSAPAPTFGIVAG